MLYAIHDANVVAANAVVVVVVVEKDKGMDLPISSKTDIDCNVRSISLSGLLAGVLASSLLACVVVPTEKLRLQPLPNALDELPSDLYRKR